MSLERRFRSVRPRTIRRPAVPQKPSFLREAWRRVKIKWIGSGVPTFEDLFRRKQPVQGRWKAGVDRHLHDDLDYLVAR